MCYEGDAHILSVKSQNIFVRHLGLHGTAFTFKLPSLITNHEYFMYILHEKQGISPVSKKKKEELKLAYINLLHKIIWHVIAANLYGTKPSWFWWSWTNSDIVLYRNQEYRSISSNKVPQIVNLLFEWSMLNIFKHSDVNGY